MDWTVGPQKICPSTNSLVPVHVTSLWKAVFANVITLGVLRWDHPGFFKWALLLKSYPMIRKEDTENRRNTEKRIERPFKDGDREWSYAGWETPGISRSWDVKRDPPWRHQRDSGSAVTLNWVFWPPEMWDDTFPLVQATTVWSALGN